MIKIQLTKIRKQFLIVLILIGIIVFGFIFGRGRFERWQVDRLRIDIPDPITFTDELSNDKEHLSTSEVNIEDQMSNVSGHLSDVETKSSITNHQSPITNSIPSELNLSVPFTSQAPFANWDYEHEEFCEEASVLMAGRYFQGRGIEGPKDAESAMQELAVWERENLGFFESTTAQETARMVREVYGLEVEVINIETNESSDVSGQLSDVRKSFIKQSLSDNKLIIVPAAGRKLKNPYFKQPGPLYHMLVIKGFTKKGDIITNDPGTKRGADFVYTFDRLYSAIGDWNNGDPETGEKLVIIVSKR